MAFQHSLIKEIDKLIGQKVYVLRRNKGLSRYQLASIIGVSHQQLQKYEKATNRISVGRLVLIATALGKSVMYFYEGIEMSTKSDNILTKHPPTCMCARHGIEFGGESPL